MTANKQIVIAGAGLVGSLLAIMLSKRGYKVSVYERRPDMRKERISAGRSINLALSDRGWRAIERVGISDEIRKVAIPMYGRMIHDLKGNTSFYNYGEKDQAIYSVSRGGLNCVLMDLAEHHGAEIFFNERIEDIDLNSATLHIENTITKQKSEIKAERIFGADGGFAASRLQLQLKTDRFNYSQSYLDAGYKELTIPAAEGGGWRMEKNALHIWPRGQYMLIALPNMDGSFTCTLFFPFEGDPSFASLDTKEKMMGFFREKFPDAVELMPDLEKLYFENPTSSLVTVRCFPWHYRDKMVLIGDAAHAIVPFYGQGMNCGFEDCTVLDDLMKDENDWEQIFSKFERSRKPNSDAIAELAVLNFIEMRDLVAQPEFILRKKIEASFHEKYPHKWLPLYSMVTFSDKPYSEALQEGRRQDRIMEKVMSIPGIEEKWDSKEVEDLMLKESMHL